MRILVADDEAVTRKILTHTLERWKFEVITAVDGESAWTVLSDGTPTIAILDWMMPKIAGPALCRRLRDEHATSHVYVLLLTARGSRDDLVAGLDAGADDYIVKPFDPDELKARVNVGVRVLGLQQKLAEQVSELQDALSKVRQLSGMLPICSYCKRIRSDQDYWEHIESYIGQHSDTQFSHGICPSCMDRAMNDFEVPDADRPKLKPGGWRAWLKGR
jgi:sigma-B regulation protein RsbU (phosphoserine phosphatase)